MSPHDGCGAWIPIPRKLSPDSSRTIVANWLEPITRIGARVLGRMCRATIRRSLAPRVYAASTYSPRRGEPPAELRFHRVAGGEHRGEHAGEDGEREQEAADHRLRVQGTAVRRRGPGPE